MSIPRVVRFLPLFLSGFVGAQTALYGGLGVATTGLKRVSTSADGSKGLLGPLSYPLSLKAAMPFWGFSRLYLATDFTPLGRKSPEGQVRTTSWWVRFPLAFGLGSGLEVLTGLAYVGHSQKGSGSTVTLNNGSSTAQFGTPSYRKTSHLWALDLGLNFKIEKFLISNEILVEGFAQSSKRNYAMLIGLSYFLGGL